MISTRFAASAILLILAVAPGCKTPVADYCEQSSDCSDLGKPFCDVNGDYDESDHIARTCIPFPDDATKDFCLDDDRDCPSSAPVCGADRICRGCTASAECGDAAGYCDVASGTCLACEPDKFQRCDGADLVVCNDSGTGEDVTTCSTTCDGSAMRCVDCTPDAFLGCTDATTASICSSTGVPTDTDCAHACNATDMRCEQCEPSTETCDSATEMHVVCDAAGEVSIDETCSLGCSPGLQPICADVDPSNGLATYLDMTASAASLNLLGVSTIDTGTGEVTTDGTPITVPNFFVGNGNDIRVFVVKDLTITGTLTVTGTHALAIVSDRDITIGGKLIVAAVGATPGPGGRSDPAGACTGKSADTTASGGTVVAGAGGGAFGMFGGAGGDLENTSLSLTIIGGAAGLWSPSMASASAALVPLLAGCSGGSAVPDGAGNIGGGGGGAVQLVSRKKIHFAAGGEVNAGGGGGQGSASNGGAGGGSGGGILLEAPEVTATGLNFLLAIGGGGGCGAEDTPDPSLGSGRDGQDADPTASYQVNGGTCRTDGIDTRGGYGHPMLADGDINAPSITGNDPRGTGGGAGGNGIIRINDLVVDGVAPTSVVIGAYSEGELGKR